MAFLFLSLRIDTWFDDHLFLERLVGVDPLEEGLLAVLQNILLLFIFCLRREDQGKVLLLFAPARWLLFGIGQLKLAIEQVTMVL